LQDFRVGLLKVETTGEYVLYVLFGSEKMSFLARNNKKLVYDSIGNLDLKEYNLVNLSTNRIDTEVSHRSLT